jgi:UDP-N-acetylglucosamine transferase subunit ALG13
MTVFVTVGFQFPFDRLIKAIDQMAPSLKDVTIIAQGSQTSYKAKHIHLFDFAPPNVFNQYLSEAQLIVSHAGMGTILTALEKGKSILVMPRLTKYGEVTTEHQLATAKKLEEKKYVHVAYNEYELKNKLPGILQACQSPLHTIQKYASGQLINSIQSFMFS